MSLFPAYSNKVKDVKKSSTEATDIGNDTSLNWLTNTSFSGNSTNDTTKLSVKKEPHRSSSNENDHRDMKEHCKKSSSDVEFNESNSDNHDSEGRISKHHHKSRKKKKKRKRERHEKITKRRFSDSKDRHRDQDNILTEVEGLFYTDKRRELGNLRVKTLSRPAVPLYNRPKLRLIQKFRKQCVVGKNKSYRYYNFDYGSISSSKLSDKQKSNCDSDGIESTSTKDININIENEIVTKTQFFNVKLDAEPNNVELWLQYVKFQDSLDIFKKHYGSFKSNFKKIIAEKKIAILEKAISLNPSSEKLLKEKLSLAELVYPPGKLLNEAMEMINKDKSNLTLWRTVIRCSQFNLAKCTAPGVLKAFGNALEQFHQTRMRHLSNRYNENSSEITKIMLVLLVECGLFMRQAGLWEELLVLLKQYLEMNVSTYYDEINEFYKFDVVINENAVRDTEESILRSNLPLSAIWLRIERLRESCYFLPLTDDTADNSKNSDPQRLVFIDDIKHLVQPILPSSFNLNLVVAVLYLMKVPLLPSTHLAFEVTRTNDIPYMIDAVENLLPVFYPTGLVEVKKGKYFLCGITDLVNGPQYFNEKIGRKEFLTLIINMFKSASKQLRPPEAVVLNSWFLRFYRVLICLSKIEENVTFSDADKKSFKKVAKEKLKEPQYRNELQLYNEYALLERDLGNDEAALNVLLTAIKLRRYTYEKATYVSLYRNTVETLLRSRPNENRQKAIDILCDLVNSDTVEATEDKFKHITAEATATLLQSEISKGVELTDVMMPHWCVEWITCHSYFLMLTKSIWAASALVQEFIDAISLNLSSCNLGSLVCEGLHETLVIILHFYCNQTNTSYHILRDLLQRAHKAFPNNIYFLHTVSVIETSAGNAGSQWWKLSSTFMSSQYVLPRLFLIFILRYKISVSIEDAGWTDTSRHNLMLALFNRLINEDTSKRCPLIWRLYLQFVSVSKPNYDLKTMFYRAVEECPWVKALYVDAIQLVPDKIQEIQDLLIEKELRLHSVMDELDILRNDSV